MRGWLFFLIPLIISCGTDKKSCALDAEEQCVGARVLLEQFDAFLLQNSSESNVLEAFDQIGPLVMTDSAANLEIEYTSAELLVKLIPSTGIDTLSPERISSIFVDEHERVRVLFALEYYVPWFSRQLEEKRNTSPYLQE